LGHCYNRCMSKDDKYIGVLLEDIQDKLKGLAEAMAGLINKVNVMDKRLKKVEENTKLIRAILLAQDKAGNQPDINEFGGGI
jgi:hypothetical protein